MDNAKLSQFFPLGACIDGLSHLFQSIYGVRLAVEDTSAEDLWSPDVYKLVSASGEFANCYCASQLERFGCSQREMRTTRFLDTFTVIYTSEQAKLTKTVISLYEEDDSCPMDRTRYVLLSPLYCTTNVGLCLG